MARKTKYVALMVHEKTAANVRKASQSVGMRICALIEDWCGKNYKHTQSDIDNEPIVITGQGDYKNEIRPTDM